MIYITANNLKGAKMEEENAIAAEETQVESATTENEVVTQENNAEEQSTEVQTVPIHRFKEVYGKMKDLERKVKESDTLKSQQEPVQLAQEEPKLEDFDYDDVAYARAIARYEASRQFEQLEQQKKAESEKRKQDELISKFHTRAAELVAQDESYQRANEQYQGEPFNQTIENALYMSERGAELHRFLMKNPQEVESLNSMNPTQALMKIGQLEMSLGQKKEIKKTSAPEPIETVNSTASLASTDWNEAGISMDEYMKRRRAAGY